MRAGPDREDVGGSTPLLSDLKNFEARYGTNQNIKLQSVSEIVSPGVSPLQTYSNQLQVACRRAMLCRSAPLRVF